MANLKYGRACKVLGIQAVGDWPDCFDAEQIAQLQCRAESRLLRDSLIADCRSGSLEHTAKVERMTRKAASAPGASTTSLIRDALRDSTCEATVYRIAAQDVRAWLAAQGEKPSEHIQNWFASATPAPVEPSSDEAAKPLQRSAAQDAAILRQIKDLGFDPLTVPKNQPGKAGVKSAVRNALSKDRLFTGAKVFDKAWERLSKNGEIVIQG